MIPYYLSSKVVSYNLNENRVLLYNSKIGDAFVFERKDVNEKKINNIKDKFLKKELLNGGIIVSNESDLNKLVSEFKKKQESYLKDKVPDIGFFCYQ